LAISDIACRIEREPRAGVVPSAKFGAAPFAVARSDARSRVIEYRGPDAFELDG